ncbi:hypothetical protein [Frigoriglobus tundricola]|uniref:Uncharacterized protein n=1 Tax=Frigoriglobus tundricola TaxID=2774151 RepID=A0A6M5YT65_9BACT|nr:hypothetical protein [Frigoriglobus tundricola]QJW97049.1 hypothetical protein FTUN_4613 [Frigoriglobus tundricola]
MSHDRRSVLTALGLALPLGIDTRFAPAAPVGPAPVLRLRSFEEAVREAFRSPAAALVATEGRPRRRVEIGHSEEVLAGLQGCHNDRPFAGYPTGHLRIVRLSSGPGPAVHGVRLYVTTVDVALTGGRSGEFPGRLFDFARIPPAPVLVTSGTADEAPEHTPLVRPDQRAVRRTVK